MLDNEPSTPDSTTSDSLSPDSVTPGDGIPPSAVAADPSTAPDGVTEAPKKVVRRRATKATAAPTAAPASEDTASDDNAAAPAEATTSATESAEDAAPKKATKRAPAKKATPRKRAAAKAETPAEPSPEPTDAEDEELAAPAPAEATDEATDESDTAAPRRRTRAPAVVLTFQPPVPTTDAPAPRQRRRAGTAGAINPADVVSAEAADEQALDATADEDTDDDTEGGARPRRRRGRRGRGGAGNRPSQGGDGTDEDDETENGVTTPAAHDEPRGEASEDDEDDDDSEDGPAGSGTRRRRRRRRSGGGGGGGQGGDGDDDVPTVVHVREPGSRQGGSGAGSGGGQSRTRNRDGGGVADEDGVRGISGSTRMAAKRVRRQEGRDSGRKRAPIVSEAEFLARREAVERQMVVRQKGDRTQIAVLEDGILVEHYVTKASATSYAGNVYLGRVQNVLPSMEAAFVDIGKGRNAVLYAGEVNWEGVSGGSRKIEQVLKSGQEVLVQVSKDPIGHKGARLTSQISLPGRYLVYVPESSMTGISRKLPENERTRLKNILKSVVPDGAGVIIRTAAEGVSEEEIAKDVRRLQAQWEVISGKVAAGGGPKQLHAEPDLVIKVVRDIFNEDFTSLVVQGESEWETIREYVEFVAPDLAPRLSRFAGNGDVFTEHRIDEQLLKALDRKVHLPSGGSLVIDRTEAMVVVDVNTGKYVGKGGNLEETVTRNNLEAAEEIARQLRLRDLGGIIVVDFIDMVLESNRDLVVRRLVECLGRDRTKHQVAEVTSLGLVQMTRKRVGQGLLESFSEPCEACNGRGVKVHLDPIEPKAHREDRDRSPRVGPKPPLPAGAPAPAAEPAEAGGSRNRRRRGGRGQGAGSMPLESAVDPSNELAEILATPQAPLDEVTDVTDVAEVAEVTEVVAQTETVVEEPAAETAPVEVAEGAAPAKAAEVAAEAEADAAPDPIPSDLAPEPVAEVPSEPVKKRRRAASRPAGSPTD